jgi:hypothetical protein
MVCYARPVSRFAALVVIALLVFGRPVSHFLDTAALAVAVTVATGGAAVAAALALAAFMSTRRRRAAGGGCMSCQFRCQHAMTEPSRRRLWLVSTADRSEPIVTHARSAATHARPTAVFLPMPSVRPAAPGNATVPAVTCEAAAARWPDRPVHRASPAAHRAASHASRTKALSR